MQLVYSMGDRPQQRETAAQLTPGRTPAMRVLGLCTITYKRECQQAEGRKTPSEFPSGIWYWLTLGRGKKLLLSGFTVDSAYTGRSSQFWTESKPGSAHPDSVLRLHFNADGWGKASSVPGRADCCVGCCVDGTVCVPLSASNISIVSST